MDMPQCRSAATRNKAMFLSLMGVLLLPAEPSPTAAGTVTRGTVITSGTYETSTRYRMHAYGIEYYSHETHTGDWKVEDLTTSVRINDAWVKYTFQIPDELYDHRLIYKIKGTHRYHLSAQGRRTLPAFIAARKASMEQLNKLAA